MRTAQLSETKMSLTVTFSQLRKIAPGARSDLVTAIVRGWPTAVEKAKLTTKLRACHFIAQIMTETGGLSILSESGAYRESQIIKIFGVGHHSAKVTSAEAAKIAALPVAQRSPVLFNRVYGVGNPTKMREFNNTGPNDGWLYRGGGMMQCTGKSNYAAMAKKTGLPLVEHPELLHQPDSAFMAAYLEWAQDGRCNAAADRDDVTAVRRVINGGTNGLAICKTYLAKAKTALSGYGGAAPVALMATPVDSPDTPSAAADENPEVAAASPAPTVDDASEDAAQDVAQDVAEEDVDPAPPIVPASDAGADEDPELLSVKKRLKAMNFSPGVLDQKWGGMTAGAISGFINDREMGIPAPTSLAMFDEIHDQLVEEITQAEKENFKRPVTEAREKGDPKTIAAVAPEIVPAKRNFWATISAMGVTFLTAIWETIENWVSWAWSFLSDHKDDLPSPDSGYVTKAWDVVHHVPPQIWWLLAFAGLGVLAWNGHKAVSQIKTAVQSGARQ
jgi:predicted chitinase